MTRNATPSVKQSLRKYQDKRDFEVTREPSGSAAHSRSRTPSAHRLAFVIQKHAASHLHFDLRLEVDGVMKSWAVPKGLSVDTSVKRLAMEVEDHPMDYNKFEGTIPQDEYGGGTVMLWDRGTWTPDEAEDGESDNDAARRALAAGKLAFTFHGVHLKGSYALIRTRRIDKRGDESRSQWLLVKHRDRHATTGRDIVAEVTTSVRSGRTLAEIAAADNDELRELEDVDTIAPMKPTTHALPLPAGVFALEVEPEGTRVMVFLANGTVRLVDTHARKTNRDGKLLDTAPNVEGALLHLARSGGALVLDGALHGDHLTVTDMLLERDEVLTEEPWLERRSRLEVALSASLPSRKELKAAVSLTDWLAVTSNSLTTDAVRAAKHEKLVAKRIDSPYESGTSSFWLRIRQ